MSRLIFALAVVGVVALVAVGVLVAAQVVAPAGPSYVDPAYGFSIRGPAFPKVDQGTVIPVMFCAPAENSFASNVNIIVESRTTTREAYRKASLDQFKTMGFTVTSDKDATIAGKDAFLVNYEGTMQGRDVRWLAMCVIDTNRVFVITCTALKEGFPKVEKEFLACVNSFKLTK
jgi:hypothetical protein